MKMSAIGLVALLAGCVAVTKQPCDGTFMQADRRWQCVVSHEQSVPWYPYGVGQGTCYEVKP